MKVSTLELPDVLLIEPNRHGDQRGFFAETWHQQRYHEAGLRRSFVQDNVSFSARGTLRGLHFQNPRAQGKLVYVLQGEIFDVAVDVRLGSPTFGRWFGLTLSSEDLRQLFVPEGFAHGFCVTSPTALVAYKCTGFYAPEAEHSLLWNDPDLGITWPVEKPTTSAKDAAALPLAGLREKGVLPVFESGG
jgi:dTDP-4-dehydrorhamnose 3,5-epimerase